MDQVLTSAQITGDSYAGPVDTSFNFVLPEGGIGPDANLTNFLSQPGNYEWTIMAGDSTGTNASGTRRYFTSIQRDFSVNPSTISNNNLNANYGNLEGMLASLNGELPDVSGSSTPSNGKWVSRARRRVRAERAGSVPVLRTRMLSVRLRTSTC